MNEIGRSMNNSVFASEYVALHFKSDPLSAFDKWKHFFREARDNGDFQTCYQLLQEIKRLSLPSVILAEVRFQEGILHHTLDNWQAAEKCFSGSLKIFDDHDDKRQVSKVATRLADSLKK